MKCPSCATLLTLADRQGVEIDYCPQCRGIWLDRGELDKLLERARRDDESRSERDDSDDRHRDEDEHGDSSRRNPPEREPFWSNIFDFG